MSRPRTLPADPFRAIADFALAIQSAGLGIVNVRPYGDIHRFHVDGDRLGTRNGWYSLHMDVVPAGAFGSWRTAETHSWCAGSRDRMTPRQQADIRHRIEAARSQREAEIRERQVQAAAMAQSMLVSAPPADPERAYLKAKGIEAHGTRQRGGALLVPVYVGERIASVQSIFPDGSKRFLPGGRIKGGYYRIADAVTRPEILICEGFATGASLHEEIGAAVVVAFNAGNLASVARSIRAAHPGAEIIVCADNDQWTAGNPGLTKAGAAAIEIGAKLLIPDFTGMDLSGHPSDWNDLYRLRRAAGGRVAA